MTGTDNQRRPPPTVVDRPVDLRQRDGEELDSLPEGLSAPSIRIASDSFTALPAWVSARRISINGKAFASVGRGLRCDVLDLRGTAIEAVPQDIQVRQRAQLDDCRKLRALPAGFSTGSLSLRNCVSLRELPPGLDVAFLDLSGCVSLAKLPDDLRMRGGHLSLRDCAGITRLPETMGELAGLDLSGCLNLSTLPEGLRITSWLDLGGSGIADLPADLDHVGLRWRGVPVSRRIVFEPETLTSEEILGERNAELRRVMMERVGFERLLAAANAVEVDRDVDAGGLRRLLKIELEGDEDLVCVSVICPSTGHHFVLRVPPTMTTCRQAVAWTAGYDNPDDYAPQKET